ncbi:MAG: hypothetical protein AABX23_04885 [Nanoarchaeota archaeon]
MEYGEIKKYLRAYSSLHTAFNVAREDLELVETVEGWKWPLDERKDVTIASTKEGLRWKYQKIRENLPIELRSKEPFRKLFKDIRKFLK